MLVSSDLTFETLQHELEQAAPFLDAAGLSTDRASLQVNSPLLFVTFRNASDELFFAEFDCRDYPMYPPTIEFVNDVRSQRGLPGLYPAGFHGMPCVCARYNRKAYSERGGPHGDWRLVDWQLPTGNGPRLDSLVMIVSDLHSKIATSTGRLQ